MLLKQFATLGIALFTICASGISFAQGTPNPATPPAAEKETWKAPFGGNFTAGFAFLNDYSYRGISQTQLQVAAQVNVGYETPTISEAVPLSAYVGAWGSNVYFPNTGTIAEIDLLTGLRLKTMEDKLTFDLGYIRYNYLGAASNLFYDFNEFGLVGGYDFGVAQLNAAVRYSPNFFANSGIAWYSQTPASPGTSGPRSPFRCPSSRSTRTSPSRSSETSATSTSSASPTTAFPPTTTGTGSSAPWSRSTASTSLPRTPTPTSTSLDASTPRTARDAPSSASRRPSERPSTTATEDGHIGGPPGLQRERAAAIYGAWTADISISRS